jgi:site-specific recombinase XerD
MSRVAHDFTSVADAWLDAQRSLGRSPNSLYTYRSALDNLRRFLRKRRICDAGLVSVTHLLAWQDRLRAAGCTTATLEVFTLIVHRWFAWQVATGRLFQNPARGLRTPKYTPPNTRCPSEAQMRRLLSSIKGRNRYALRNRAILETAYATGARLAEMAALDLTSLDLKERSLRLFGKGQRERVVPLTRTAVRALRAYLRLARPKFVRGASGQTALFVGLRDSQRMKTPAFTGVLKKHARKIGLVFTMHDIRRAFATHLLAGGAHPTAVKDMLGHQGYKHLRSYLRLHPEASLNAVRHNRIFR